MNLPLERTRLFRRRRKSPDHSFEKGKPAKTGFEYIRSRPALKHACKVKSRCEIRRDLPRTGRNRVHALRLGFDCS